MLLTWGTTHFAAVPVSGPTRPAGAFRELVKPAFDLLAFTNWPLRAASLAGFAFIGLGLAGGLRRPLLAGSGWPAVVEVASVLAIAAGVQLLAFGVIGGHLARRRFPAMGQPAYAVRARTPEPEPERP